MSDVRKCNERQNKRVGSPVKFWLGADSHSSVELKLQKQNHVTRNRILVKTLKNTSFI